MAELRTPTSPSADGEAEGETARPLRETSRRVLTNLHVALPFDPTAVLPGIDSGAESYVCAEPAHSGNREALRPADGRTVKP